MTNVIVISKDQLENLLRGGIEKVKGEKTVIVRGESIKEGVDRYKKFMESEVKNG